MTTCDARTTVLGMPINLDIRIADAQGVLVTPDSVPQVEIKNSYGTILRAFSSTGVTNLGVGLYRLIYTPVVTEAAGSWSDLWQTVVSGQPATGTLNFTVLDESSISAAGAEIGDAPCVIYSQAEIDGINILLAQLKCRLKNDGQAEVLDENGNKTYVDCPIFSDEELLCFLVNSLSEWNAVPHWTSFGFDSPIIYQRNAHLVVEGAYIIALGAQMLIEAGREFSISDNGITFQNPPLSTVINNQFSTLLTAHTEKVKFAKVSYKPSPVGVGTFRVLSVSPALTRLRHLRERQII